MQAKKKLQALIQNEIRYLKKFRTELREKKMNRNVENKQKKEDKNLMTGWKNIQMEVGKWKKSRQSSFHSPMFSFLFTFYFFYQLEKRNL